MLPMSFSYGGISPPSSLMKKPSYCILVDGEGKGSESLFLESLRRRRSRREGIEAETWPQREQPTVMRLETVSLHDGGVAGEIA
jgi:hypothetical protein